MISEPMPSGSCWRGVLRGPLPVPSLHELFCHQDRNRNAYRTLLDSHQIRTCGVYRA